MSVQLIDTMGSDLSVVNAARVSFHKESFLLDGEVSEKDVKLISYLATNNHWSPFAHTSLQFRIKAPIFVARQLVKHQVGGVWNEVSRRYVDDEPEFYKPKAWHKRPVNVKQGSSEETLMEDYEWFDMPVEVALEAYTLMLKEGVAPEQARMVLPQNTMTEWIWTGSLMFFARVCKLRLDAHAQQEAQEIAKLIAAQIPQKFEHSWKALMS